MCMCGKPTINGQGKYSWDGRTFMDYPPNPPTLADGDSLIFDEPGRCNIDTDSHSHHFRLVKDRHDFALLVRHGGGDERFIIKNRRPGVRCLLDAMQGMDTHGRYWTLHLLYYIHRDAANSAQTAEWRNWAKAAIEKRIKVCRRRRGAAIVRIEDARAEGK